MPTPLPSSSEPAVSADEAIAIAQQVYRPAPVGGTCDDQGSVGSDHYAACPLAAALAARFAAEAPDGMFTAGPPCQASCDLPLLCQCQYGPITYQDYAASASPAGWTVRLTTNNPATAQWFILDISESGGRALVTHIAVQVSNGCIRPIDGAC